MAPTSSPGIGADTFQSTSATAGAPGLVGSCLAIHCLPFRLCVPCPRLVPTAALTIPVCQPLQGQCCKRTGTVQYPMALPDMAADLKRVSSALSSLLAGFVPLYALTLLLAGLMLLQGPLAW